MLKRVLVLVAAASALTAAPSAFGANSVTYPDSDTAAESPSAADITSVVVSNDDAATLTFQVNIANQAVLPPGSGVTIFLDTDQNASTGATARGVGIDEAFSVIAGGQVTFAHWDGTQLTTATAPPSLTGVYSATGATFRISAKDFGNPKSIVFVAGTVTGAIGDGSNLQFDWAPESSSAGFLYDIRVAVRLIAGRLKLSPVTAKAGKPLTVSLPVTESDTAGPIAAGQVLCSATLAGRRLGASAKGIAGGAASCRLGIPRGAKGKTIRGTITVVVHGTRLTKAFSARVK